MLKHILFVDDDPVFLASFRAETSKRWKDWRFDATGTARDAMTMLNAHSADVVIASLRLPGTDGVRLLAGVMERFPRTTRIIQAQRSDRSSCFKTLGVAHQFLVKPMDWDRLADTIQRADFQRRTLESPSLRALVSRLQTVPSFPGLYLDLIQALGAEHPSVNDIAKIVRRDPGMCSKLMQLVNSAFFGLPRRVSDISEAVQFLGVETIKTLVLHLHIIAFFAQQPVREFDFEALWEHCWQTGLLAKELAEKSGFGEETVNDSFCAGLLHDVGKLVLATGVPKLYSNALKLSAEKGIPLFEAELVVFGATHAEVGACLLGVWGLPVSILLAVAGHHKQGQCRDETRLPNSSEVEEQDEGSLRQSESGSDGARDSDVHAEGCLAPLIREANRLAHRNTNVSAI